MKKNKVIIIFLFLALSLFFVPRQSFADPTLPTQAGLDGACNTSNSGGDAGKINNGTITACSLGLTCYNSQCLECQTSDQCATNYTCDNGVCLKPGGNSINAFCRSNGQCQSGKCGANNLCLSATTTASPTVTPSPTTTGGFTGMDVTVQDLFNIVTGLACWLLRIAGAVMVIFVVLAGLRFVWAQGNPTKYQEARKNINHVFIGVLVILGVYVIIATVANAIGITNFSFVPLVC